MDDVFKALADATRRSILDALHVADGQTLSAIAARFDMSRFGVMKHLTVLEEAGLVLTRRRGREKLHFLNAIPIRLLHDRWISKYEEPWAAGLSDLTTQLETTSRETTMEKIYEIYIKTTPERLWEAITDHDIRAKFQFGQTLTGDWRVGGRFSSENPAMPGMSLGEGEVLDIDPPNRLVNTFVALWGDEVASEGASRVTWDIVKIGEDSCQLTVTHDQLREGANEELYGGWPMILSGLKTWLETGEVLTTPGSLRYVQR